LDNNEGTIQNYELIHQDITNGSEVNSNSLSQSQSLDLLNINQSTPNINTIETQDIIDSKPNNTFINSPNLQNPQMHYPTTHYHPNQNQYPPNQNQYPPNQNQYPSNQNQYPSNQNQYPSNQNQYPSNQNQYPPNQNQYSTMQYHPNQNQNTQVQNHQMQYPIMQYPPNQNQNSQIQNHQIQSPRIPINYNNINRNNYNSSDLENHINGNIPQNNFTNNFQKLSNINNSEFQNSSVPNVANVSPLVFKEISQNKNITAEVKQDNNEALPSYVESVAQKVSPNEHVFVAHYYYNPQFNDEFQISPGDVISFGQSTYDDGWAHGSNLTKKTTGVFPLGIVIKVTDVNGNNRDIYQPSEKYKCKPRSSSHIVKYQASTCENDPKC